VYVSDPVVHSDDAGVQTHFTAGQLALQTFGVESVSAGLQHLPAGRQHEHRHRVSQLHVDLALLGDAVRDGRMEDDPVHLRQTTRVQEGRLLDGCGLHRDHGARALVPPDSGLDLVGQQLLVGSPDPVQLRKPVAQRLVPLFCHCSQHTQVSNSAVDLLVSSEHLVQRAAAVLGRHIR